MIALISPKDACEITSLNRSTIERLIAAGEFPKPVRITRGRVAFDKSAVEAWIASKLEMAA